MVTRPVTGFKSNLTGSGCSYLRGFTRYLKHTSSTTLPAISAARECSVLHWDHWWLHDFLILWFPRTSGVLAETPWIHLICHLDGISVNTFKYSQNRSLLIDVTLVATVLEVTHFHVDERFDWTSNRNENKNSKTEVYTTDNFLFVLPFREQNFIKLPKFLLKTTVICRYIICFQIVYIHI